MVLGIVVGLGAGFGIFQGVRALLADPPAKSDGGYPLVSSVTGQRATIWAVGDGEASAAGRAVTDRIASAPFDRLLYLGDVYGSGSAEDFARNYAPTYGRLARRTAPTPGNHDWPNHETGYDPYWRRALGRRRAAGWYAFSAGGWRILSLNSETSHAAKSPQGRWLRSQLRAPGTCRIAFWHRPRFSAGRHGDQPDTASLWNALRGHATIVLGGHDHGMQRMRAKGTITQFVSGAGGRSHYGVDRDDRRLAFSDDRTYGALRLVLRPGSAAFAFVAADGRVLDSGTVRCRR
jgi:hypothetical protein